MNSKERGIYDAAITCQTMGEQSCNTIAEKELIFEELFKGYDGEKFTAELQSLSPVGNEKW